MPACCTFNCKLINSRRGLCGECCGAGDRRCGDTKPTLMVVAIWKMPSRDSGICARCSYMEGREARPASSE
eukprot:16445560-Heterocapsa_arctica.AAC.1